MKKNILYIVTGIVVLLSLISCSEDDRYNTSVVRQFKLYEMKDNEYVEWKLNTGISTKPLFIYRSNGEYFANYSTHYRFALENGMYRIVATPIPYPLIATATDVPPVNLNELVIPQFPNADQRVQVSRAVEYSSPFNEELQLYMGSHTGTLRLKAIDTKADKSYSTVRAIVTTQRSGYRPADDTYVEEPIELTRSKATATGGVNYTDDFVVFRTANRQKQIAVRFELLDADGNVTRSKELDDLVFVYPDTATLVTFELNDTENPIIQNYTVSVVAENWTDEELRPDAPIKVPNGFTYVAPTDDINAVYNSLKNDASVAEIKLYLKAGESYTFTSKTLNDAPKAIHIVGQLPAAGQQAATVKLDGNVSLGANTGTPVQISTVRFENLILKPSGDFFRYKNQDFEVQDIIFKNCEFPTLPATMWYQVADGNYMQVIHNFTMEDCFFSNISLGGSGLLGLGNKQILPIYNIVFRNSTFHAKTLGTAALITNLNKIDKNLTVTIENCTLVNLGGGDMTFFKLDGSGADTFTLIVKNNLLSGNAEAGKGTWLNLKAVTSRTITGNYHTNGFVLNNWGVNAGEEPTALPVAMDGLFRDAANADLTIKDKTSAVYTNRIGDPRWLD
ncbi:DUF5123 domain-containing protein [Alistipes sp. OttesenSCG-928-L06]|nr:DUF5123 domain-containing protein [Alistipes sp. OttesenSCG-928-L06]